MENTDVHRAVIPAAGRGTRTLPATKAIPKELLPVVDRPAIEYVVEEATKAGIDDVMVITSASKNAIEDHFDACPELETALETTGKHEYLKAINRYRELATIHSIRQGHPRGLGHAVYQARQHIGDEPFAVLLPDDLMHPDDTLLQSMIAVRQRLGGSVVALLEVTPEQATAYGSAAVTPIGEQQLDATALKECKLTPGDVFRLDQVIEKPRIENVLSRYATVGRYIFDPAIWPILQNQTPGRGGEIQLTDAFAQLINTPTENGGGVWGVVIRGRRYDTGDTLGWLKAQIDLGLQHPRYGADLANYLQQRKNGDAFSS